MRRLGIVGVKSLFIAFASAILVISFLDTKLLFFSFKKILDTRHAFRSGKHHGSSSLMRRPSGGRTLWYNLYNKIQFKLLGVSIYHQVVVIAIGLHAVITVIAGMEWCSWFARFRTGGVWISIPNPVLENHSVTEWRHGAASANDFGGHLIPPSLSSIFHIFLLVHDLGY